MSEEEKKVFSRRDFIKSAAVVAGGAALVGCTPKVATPEGEAQPTAAPAADGSTPLNAELASQKWNFEIPPEPIADADIANTVEADIIVVGGGHSGLITANAAAENGAKVVVISASSAPSYRGGSMAAVYSKEMEIPEITKNKSVAKGPIHAIQASIG